MILALWAMIVVSAAFHEFGHAAACRYGGATPGAMGAGLYLVWPAFYTEVTDSYRLGRAGRLRVDLGGLYFNAVFTVAVRGRCGGVSAGTRCSSSSWLSTCRWCASWRRSSVPMATTSSRT